MERVLILIVFAVTCLGGCAMFTAWKSIPPPGGCDQCHTAAISSNWKVSYQVANVSDERGRQVFQTPEYNMTFEGKQDTPSGMRKVEELQCFECHRLPTPAHREMKGRFHH